VLVFKPYLSVQMDPLVRSVLCKEKALRQSWKDRGWEICKWMITGRSTFARKFTQYQHIKANVLVKQWFMFSEIEIDVNTMC
jgi:hypothetical protein